jgi:ribonuclease HI
MTAQHVTIYTDGGCNPNPGPGGWGAVIIDDNGTETELSGGALDTTNNQMELTAVITTLDSLKTPHTIDLYLDSQYVKNGLNEWMAGWVRKGWRTSTGDPVKNVELWKALYQATQRHTITWHWVRGHTGVKYNERVDELATAAMPKSKKVTLSNDRLVVFIRVAVPKNDGAGGWALRVWDGKEATDHSGRLPKVTSANELELRTAFQIFKTVPKDVPLQIFCPSDYLYKGMTQWLEGWKKRGWVSSTGSKVKYEEIWRGLDEATRTRDVQWVWEERDNSPAIAKGLDQVAKWALQG